MTTTPDPRGAARSGVVAVSTDQGSHVDWSSVLGGVALAAALSFVLFAFGGAIGLSAVSAEPGEGVSLRWMTIASGIWFVWVAISSFAAGGYLAGRLRRPTERVSEDETETRDGAHGVLVWAVGALLGAILATSGISGVAGQAASVSGTAAQAASEAIGGDLDYLGSRLMRGGGGDVSPAQRDELASLVGRSMADGELDASDRQYMVEAITTATGISEEEATERVEAGMAQAQDWYDAALAAAEQARVAAAIAAFVVAATLMVGAAAAYFAAAAGGSHRDRNLPFRTFGR